MEKKADNLVTMEKIGTSNYYWSFPSQAGLLRQQKLKELSTELESLKVLFSLALLSKRKMN
jgi:hypothetical protein